MKYQTTRRDIPRLKILLSIVVLIVYHNCNQIPLFGIDQIALKQALLQFDQNPALLQLISMYSGSGGNTPLTPFSLGIIPFINASILVDLLTTVFPTLEELQTEEGERGRQILLSYKKILTFLFSIGQTIILISYLKPYIYNTTFFNLLGIVLQLTAGSFLTIWFTNLIENKGIGNGTSLIIAANILGSFFRREFSLQLTPNFCFESFFLIVLIAYIIRAQRQKTAIQVVSARQLSFFGKQRPAEKNYFSDDFQMGENALFLRSNQAGIFPIIIASNLLPFFSFVFNFFGNKIISNSLTTFSYYLLIILFNYLYTTIFWDPEKIAERLRKASVAIPNITPGKQTISFLERRVRSISISGGISLCCILFSFEVMKNIIHGGLLSQFNISSLIIAIGVGCDTFSTVSSLYRIYK